jgi:hypothetical protein
MRDYSAQSNWHHKDGALGRIIQAALHSTFVRIGAATSAFLLSSRTRLALPVRNQDMKTQMAKADMRHEQRMKFRASANAVLLIAVLAVGAGSVAEAQKNPLATSNQKAFEEKALRILASPVVQEQRKAIESAFSEDPLAQTTEGKATLASSVDEVLFSGVVGVLNADATRPKVQWVWAPGHSWFGLKVPGAKYIMPNVDNVFRVIPVDNISHYEITAKPGGGNIPTQWTVQLIHSVALVAGAESIYSVLIDTDIRTEPDGSFTLSVGPEAASGRSNHIQTVPGAGLLLIRDTIDRWGDESPYLLDVRRIDGPAPSTPDSDATLAEKAAELVRTEIPVVVKSKSNTFFKGAPNTLAPPKVREGGRWGLSSAGHFKLSDDEALVVTLDPIGAKYLSVQLANAWLGSLDYIHHTASLNIAQAVHNADGSYTFVIATHDPGTHNWLDTTGLHEGSFFVRWQKLPQPLGGADSAVREIKLIKLADLAGSLPSDARGVSPEERKNQLTDRAAAYARRFTDR